MFKAIKRLFKTSDEDVSQLVRETSQQERRESSQKQKVLAYLGDYYMSINNYPKPTVRLAPEYMCAIIFTPLVDEEFHQINNYLTDEKFARMLFEKWLTAGHTSAMREKAKQEMLSKYVNDAVKRCRPTTEDKK